MPLECTICGGPRRTMFGDCTGCGTPAKQCHRNVERIIPPPRCQKCNGGAGKRDGDLFHCAACGNVYGVNGSVRRDSFLRRVV